MGSHREVDLEHSKAKDYKTSTVSIHIVVVTPIRYLVSTDRRVWGD
jgi:hypothetical protein